MGMFSARLMKRKTTAVMYGLRKKIRISVMARIRMMSVMSRMRVLMVLNLMEHDLCFLLLDDMKPRCSGLSSEEVETRGRRE